MLLNAHPRKTLAASVALAVVGLGGVAQAYWTATASTAARAVAGSLPQGTQPSAVAQGYTVTLTFPAQSAGGAAMTAYRVRRYDAKNSTLSRSFECTPTVGASTVACTDANVPGGSWVYSQTPLLHSWTGAESTRSASVGVTPLTVTTSVLEQGTVATAYSQTLTATGGSGSYSWALASGSTALPKGLTLSSTGVISGTPSTTGTTSGLVNQVSDGTTSASSQTLSLTIAGVPAPSITSSTGAVNSANRTQVSASGSKTAGTTVVLTVTDGTRTVTPPVSGDASATTWSVSGVDVSSLGDGTLTYKAVARNAGGAVSTETTVTASKDTVAPTASDIQTTGGGTGTTSGRIDSGDKLTYTFSEPVSAGTVLGGWNGTTTPTVTVTLTDGAGNSNDSISSITANGAGVQLGTVDLGGRDWVTLSGNTTTTTATATMTMTGSTIVLQFTSSPTGAKTVSGHTVLTWTPSTAVTDTAGNPMAATARTEQGTSDQDF